MLHGLGFAGALREVGLPAHAIPVALLFFKVGVELGQLAFVAAVMALAVIACRIASANAGVPASWPSSTRFAGAYCIGSVAAFWFVERISGFWA